MLAHRWLRLTVKPTIGQPLLYFEARLAREVRRQALGAMHSRVLRLWDMHSATGICFCRNQQQRHGVSRQADAVGIAAALAARACHWHGGQVLLAALCDSVLWQPSDDTCMCHVLCLKRRALSHRRSMMCMNILDTLLMAPLPSITTTTILSLHRVCHLPNPTHYVQHPHCSFCSCLCVWVRHTCASNEAQPQFKCKQPRSFSGMLQHTLLQPAFCEMYCWYGN